MKRILFLAATTASLFTAVYIVGPMIKAARYTEDSKLVRSDLKQIMLALHNYHDEHRSFPPAFVVGPDGERWHSWRALILKDLAPELAKQYRFDEPWNGPHNSKLHSVAPEVLQSDLTANSDSATHYLAIIGRRTVWPADQATRLRDIIHGASNTMMVVEDRESDICWLAPEDTMGLDALKLLEKNMREDPKRPVVCAFADGSAKSLSSKMTRSQLTSLMTASGGDLYKGDRWPKDLVASTIETPFKPVRDAEDLQATVMNAVKSKSLDQNSNHLWCASLKLAWDDLEKTLGSPIIPLNQNDAIEQLNNTTLPLNLLSADSVFHGTSNGSPSSDKKLVARINKKFPDLQFARQKSSQNSVLRVVAAIRKKMPFAEEFERLSDGLAFQNDHQTSVVENFGYEPDGNDLLPIFEDQLTVVDDQGDDDFIIRLRTDGPDKDLIYLAMIPKQDTLDATWRNITFRIDQPNPQHTRPALQANETLKIPVLDFSVFQRFRELEVPILVNNQTLLIEVAYQDIRLRLDEKGADFASVAEIMITAAFEDEKPEYDPLRIRNLIFDAPFLIALQEPDADEPYFMAWIGNDELMEPSKASNR